MFESLPEKDHSMLPTDDTPRWGAPTKALVGFIFLSLTAFFLIRFSHVVGPLLLAFLLTYLLYPVVKWLNQKARLPWGMAVAVVLLVVVLVLLGLLTWSGITLVDQSKGLIIFLQSMLFRLPGYLDDLNDQVLVLGPLEYSLSNLDLNLDNLGRQLVSSIQPLFSQMGSILTSIAGGAASVIGSLVLVVMVTYFLLLENKGRPYRIMDLELPGYENDIENMGLELQRIWNGFLRGQLTMVGITIIIYSILLSVLGVRFMLGLAVMAGLARFVPWLGTSITWLVYFFVALLQGSTILGLSPLPYALLVVGVALLMDPVIDSLITPKIMGSALQVHPALLLVGVFVGTTWMGFIGLLLAGPTMATLKLLATYALRKSFDLDPWEGLDKSRIANQASFFDHTAKGWRDTKNWIRKVGHRLHNWFKSDQSEQEEKDG
jgi:predicted PurR-regulated permease PerM